MKNYIITIILLMITLAMTLRAMPTLIEFTKNELKPSKERKELEQPAENIVLLFVFLLVINFSSFMLVKSTFFGK